MRIFITGASGWIGCHVTRLLVSEGHTVIGLARNESSANVIRSLGAEVQYGTLLDLDSISVGVSRADAVIHLAYIHDLQHMSLTQKMKLFMRAVYSGIMSSVVNVMTTTDINVIQTIGKSIKGTNKKFLMASGTLYVVQYNTLQYSISTVVYCM